MHRSFRKSNNTFPNLLPGGRKLSLEFRQNSSHYVTNRDFLTFFVCVGGRNMAYLERRKQYVAPEKYFLPELEQYLSMMSSGSQLN